MCHKQQAYVDQSGGGFILTEFGIKRAKQGYHPALMIPNENGQEGLAQKHLGQVEMSSGGCDI